MNVTVFGATGAIGRHVVSQLLEQGHHVTAYLRTPGNLDTKHPQLRTVVGELSDATAVTEAIGGSDAVISALGPSLKRSASGTPVADGTSNIVTAMHRAGVRRFIGLATPSIADPRDRPTFKACLLPAMAKAMFPNALIELIVMTDAVTSTDLDWTIARITRPTNKPARHTLRAGYLGTDTIGSAMTRADIAAFLVAQLRDTTFERAAPAISN